MTKIIFKQWLEDLKHIIKKQKQNIFSLVDYTTSHSVTPAESNVMVRFFPPNLTPVKFNV